MSQDSVTRRDFMRLSMETIALGTLSGVGALPVSALQAAPPTAAEPYNTAAGTEMAIAGDWARSFAMTSAAHPRGGGGTLLPDRLNPPFSFVYEGRKSADLLPAWKYSANDSSVQDTARREHEVTYIDPATGLRVRVVTTTFSDFPAVESVVYFKNIGHADTPILENIQALDAPLACPHGDPSIHYSLGATCSINDFMPMTRVLGERGRLELNAGGGRSSSQFLPFFNIEAKGEGAIAAIGWTGEWATTFDRAEDPRFHVRAGMALTHLVLHPGEEIRTPRILMLFWLGEPQRGHNLLRRFILAHHRPAPGGEPFTGPIANSNWGGTSAAHHLENIRQIIAHDLPMDYYWIDAEWFGNGPWYKNPGNWEVKRDLYPQGFKPISDLLHASGRKFLLWFEPERVSEGTPWYTEHAEWLLEVPKDKRVYRGFAAAKGDWDIPISDPHWVPNESNRNQIQENDKLFNLAIPEARQFMTDFISAKIDEFGMDCFRNDANIAPLEFWRAADAPDRQGMTEIRWVEGFYAFWDDLRRRHPNLIIDDCASGGRRIDLETIGRSTVFSRTDFVGSLLANQCHSYGLLRWIPMNATLGGKLSTGNDYRIRSGMTAGFCYALFVEGDNPQGTTNYNTFPFAEIKRSLDQYRKIQKYFYGDFYPLTEYTQADDAWMAYQFDLPDSGEGLVVVIKRPLSQYTQALYPLRALEVTSSYGITNLDTGEERTMSGKELSGKGLSLRLPAQPDSALICYHRK
jgi:alpha-galactosidase